MRKVMTLFERDPETNLRTVKPEVHPDCRWVLDGVGTPTRKFDGSCVLIRAGIMYARREVKPGKRTPADFEMVAHDDVTGKTVGWIPVTDDPEWKRHHEAYANTSAHHKLFDGTYELIGPKVNGNPERTDSHELIPHGRYLFIADDEPLPDPIGVEIGLTWVVNPAVPPRDFDGLRTWLLGHDFEGIVWWSEIGNPDAPLAKLKAKDFR